MPRGATIVTMRNKYPQLALMTDDELAVMHESGKAQRDHLFLYGINKEKEARLKKKMTEKQGI